MSIVRAPVTPSSSKGLCARREQERPKLGATHVNSPSETFSANHSGNHQQSNAADLWSSIPAADPAEVLRLRHLREMPLQARATLASAHNAAQSIVKTIAELERELIIDADDNARALEEIRDAQPVGSYYGGRGGGVVPSALASLRSKERLNSSPTRSAPKNCEQQKDDLKSEYSPIFSAALESAEREALLSPTGARSAFVRSAKQLDDEANKRERGQRVADGKRRLDVRVQVLDEGYLVPNRTAEMESMMMPGDNDCKANNLAPPRATPFKLLTENDDDDLCPQSSRGGYVRSNNFFVATARKEQMMAMTSPSHSIVGGRTLSDEECATHKLLSPAERNTAFGRRGPDRDAVRAILSERGLRIAEGVRIAGQSSREALERTLTQWVEDRLLAEEKALLNFSPNDSKGSKGERKEKVSRARGVHPSRPSSSDNEDESDSRSSKGGTDDYNYNDDSDEESDGVSVPALQELMANKKRAERVLRGLDVAAGGFSRANEDEPSPLLSPKSRNSVRSARAEALHEQISGHDTRDSTTGAPLLENVGLAMNRITSSASAVLSVIKALKGKTLSLQEIEDRLGDEARKLEGARNLVLSVLSSETIENNSAPARTNQGKGAAGGEGYPLGGRGKGKEITYVNVDYGHRLSPRGAAGNHEEGSEGALAPPLPQRTQAAGDAAHVNHPQRFKMAAAEEIAIRKGQRADARRLDQHDPEATAARLALLTRNAASELMDVHREREMKKREVEKQREAQKRLKAEHLALKMPSQVKSEASALPLALGGFIKVTTTLLEGDPLGRRPSVFPVSNNPPHINNNNNSQSHASFASFSCPTTTQVPQSVKTDLSSGKGIYRPEVVVAPQYEEMYPFPESIAENVLLLSGEGSRRESQQQRLSQFRFGSDAGSLGWSPSPARGSTCSSGESAAAVEQAKSAGNGSSSTTTKKSKPSPLAPDCLLKSPQDQQSSPYGSSLGSKSQLQEKATRSGQPKKRHASVVNFAANLEDPSTTNEASGSPTKWGNDWGANVSPPVLSLSPRSLQQLRTKCAWQSVAIHLLLRINKDQKEALRGFGHPAFEHESKSAHEGHYSPQDGGADADSASRDMLARKGTLVFKGALAHAVPRPPSRAARQVPSVNASGRCAEDEVSDAATFITRLEENSSSAKSANTDDDGDDDKKRRATRYSPQRALEELAMAAVRRGKKLKVFGGDTAIESDTHHFGRRAGGQNETQEFDHDANAINNMNGDTEYYSGPSVSSEHDKMSSDYHVGKIASILKAHAFSSTKRTPPCSSPFGKDTGARAPTPLAKGPVEGLGGGFFAMAGTMHKRGYERPSTAPPTRPSRPTSSRHARAAHVQLASARDQNSETKEKGFTLTVE